ncbi:Short-chain dehydrogenase red3 [Pyricularia grisea]|nr:Short-chain dehydrogenase red3 [Pyricularia grisea]
MSKSTTVLITGANKGIGLGIAKVYLSRPNHIVICSVRSAKTDVSDLKAVSKASDSKLILVYIESTSKTDPTQAVADVKAAGVDHLDVLIANAGGMPEANKPLLELGPDELCWSVQVNAAAPLLVLQAFLPLLQKADSPRFAVISSTSGSIEFMKNISSFIFPGYGAAKATLNWLTMGVHLSQEWLTTLVIHPGLVQSEPGNWVAKQIGMAEAPTTIEQAAEGVVNAITNATRESVGGKFLSTSDGSVLPW